MRLLAVKFKHRVRGKEIKKFFFFEFFIFICTLARVSIFRDLTA